MNFAKLFIFAVVAISLVGCSGQELSSKIISSIDDVDPKKDPPPVQNYNEITVKVIAVDDSGQTSEDTITLNVPSSF